MWSRFALVGLLVLPWIAPAGAASMPTSPLSGDSVQLGPVTLTAGTSASTAVEAGQPSIDFKRGSAGGLAPGMTVVIGDPNDPETEHAFGLENRGDEPTHVRLRYEYVREPPDTAGVDFAAFTPAGNRLADGGESIVVTVKPGRSVYVVVTISTHGATPGDDLSGTIAVDVTALSNQISRLTPRR